MIDILNPKLSFMKTLFHKILCNSMNIFLVDTNVNPPLLNLCQCVIKLGFESFAI